MEIKWGVDGFLFLPGVKTSHESQSENSIVSHWCVVTEVVGNYDKPFLMGMGQVIGCVSFGSVWSPSEMLQRSGNGLFHSYFMVWYGSYPTWRWFILTQTHISVSDIYIYNYIYWLVVYNYIYVYWLVVWNIFFHNIWDNPSHWLIFFKMVKTTNQIHTWYTYWAEYPCCHVSTPLSSWSSFRRQEGPFVHIASCISAMLLHLSAWKFPGCNGPLAHGWFTDLFLWNMVIFQQAMLDYQVYMGI